MIEGKYEDYSLFAIDSSKLSLLEEVLKKNFDILIEFKNTKRNYVSLIEVKGSRYVLKFPRNEFRIPQRKFFTLFKEGEAVTTFKNIDKLEEGMQSYFARPLGAASKRKNGMVVDSQIIYEYIEGEDSRKNKDLAVKYSIKMHDAGLYHGDCNPSNFILTSKGIKIIDTQAKKMNFGRYRAHYDMLTMKMDSYSEMEYPYDKTIWYYLAYAMKRWKRLPLVEKIKAYKKKLRDKGWKV